MSSRGSRVTGQLTDGSRGLRVKKCDPFSSLLRTTVQHYSVKLSMNILSSI